MFPIYISIVQRTRKQRQSTKASVEFAVSLTGTPQSKMPHNP